MNINRHVSFAMLTFTLLASIPLPSSAALVRFTAALDAAQETTSSTSTATGSAIVLYDTKSNRLDLTVTLLGFTNTISDSHIHEGAVGVSGPPVVPLGGEVNYTRAGNTTSGTFENLTYSGTPATLLTGGAYLNIHSAAFPAGEIRGQLIPDPVKFAAVLSGSQEVPARDTQAYGAAQATYDPVTNTITTLVFVYNLTNTLTDSHIHEAPAGVNGPVRVAFGGAANYEVSETTYAQVFEDRTYNGTPLLLLNNGAYVNVHSNVFGGGEVRGQLLATTSTTQSRLVNVSARGQVGSGHSVLIAGFVVLGSEPVRVLATARGPVLTSFGVSGALADPVLSIHDSAGRRLVLNDNAASGLLPALVTGSGFAPSEPTESAAFLLLPPGAYTSVMSGAEATTGVGLAEAFEISW